MTPRRGARIVGDDGRFGARYARAYSRNDRAAALSIGSATLLSPPGAAVVGALRELAHSGDRAEPPLAGQATAMRQRCCSITAAVRRKLMLRGALSARSVIAIAERPRGEEQRVAAGP